MFRYVEPAAPSAGPNERTKTDVGQRAIAPAVVRAGRVGEGRTDTDADAGGAGTVEEAGGADDEAVGVAVESPSEHAAVGRRSVASPIRAAAMERVRMPPPSLTSWGSKRRNVGPR